MPTPLEEARGDSISGQQIGCIPGVFGHWLLQFSVSKVGGGSWGDPLRWASQGPGALCLWPGAPPSGPLPAFPGPLSPQPELCPLGGGRGPCWPVSPPALLGAGPGARPWTGDEEPLRGLHQAAGPLAASRLSRFREKWRETGGGGVPRLFLWRSSSSVTLSLPAALTPPGPATSWL